MVASAGRLRADVEGDVEVEGGVLILRRIRVVYQIEAAPEQRELIDRVHGFHADSCPVYRSIQAAIEISTEWQLRD